MVLEHYHRFPHAYQVSNQHDYRRLSGPESGPEGVVIYTGKLYNIPMLPLFAGQVQLCYPLLFLAVVF